LRAVGAVGLVGIGVVHVVDLFDMWDQSTYMAVLFGALVVGVTVAAAMVLAGRRLGWALGGVIALATIVGYVISRSIGVPDLADDIGNWKEPLGVAAIFIEGLVVLLSASVLAAGRRVVTAPVARRAVVTV
jgi:hypothetical protein